ncbi:MAG TPA: DUF3159 domain-containing protein [Actinophytocola sp.]|uniref:DUF3159 domain-containing protein n=1 Tax=Actinophytocola sp. TaxID=1872138 RepID=UPI002DB67A7F|nr:DUF3159 domain-containing protein [Actinophytocola sp.]HEU5469883.1 DUF3159 domain-containing protein [Actinophytocola sp.]
MTEPPQDAKADAPERRTLLQEMGGISGLIYSTVPVLVFVLVNSVSSLNPAIWAALGSAAVITVVRIVRKQSLQPAISGFFGVAIAAFIAYRTGSAKGFFLFGIWASLVYGSLFGLSILIRWPLVGVIWGALNGHGQKWRSDRRAMFAYDLATLSWAVVFGARFVVQRWLYDEDLTGWLAFARIAMGWPLTAAALAVTLWAVRRAGHLVRQLAEQAEADDQAVEAKLRAKYGQPASESGAG